MSIQMEHLSSNKLKAEIKRLQKDLKKRREEAVTLSPKEKRKQRRLKKIKKKKQMKYMTLVIYLKIK